MSGFDEIQLLTEPPPEKKNGWGLNYIYIYPPSSLLRLGWFNQHHFLSHSSLPSAYVGNM